MLSHTPIQETQKLPFLDVLPLGICVIGKDLQVHEWNQQLAQWTGIPREEACGTSLADRYPQLLSDQYRDRLRHAFANNCPVIFSAALHRNFIPIATRVGQARLMIQQTVVRPLSDGSERAIVTIQDVTAQYLQSEELRAVNESLEQRIDRRTAELKKLFLDLEFEKSLQEKNASQLIVHAEQLNYAKVTAESARATLEAERAELLAARFELQQKNLKLEEALEELKQTQAGLLHAEKLASVGQLAAGIAHEINTPIQFIGDNIQACIEMFDDLQRVHREHRGLLEQLEKERPRAKETELVRRIEEEVDVDYIFQDAPEAFSQSLEGIERVRTIVQAMKDFSHVGNSDEYLTFDLNAALENTLIVARNELKYVAEVETDFADLPPVAGYPGELNQVFLNLFINAAHAIQDGGGDELGTISVVTRIEGDWVVVSIGDTGCGIPESVRGKIFDPFFTTKEVGRGTGQGLAISRNIIVDRHGGQIEFETEPGVGTTFRIYLSLSPNTEKTSDVHNTRSVC